MSKSEIAPFSRQLDDALKLQDHLLRQTQDLAVEIAALPSVRNGSAIRKAWRIVDANRPRLSSLYRNMRKLKAKPRAEMCRQDYIVQRRFLNGLKLLRYRLQLWSTVESLIERHIDPASVPLIRSRPSNESDPALKMIYYAFHRLANPNIQDQGAREYGCFPDIAMNIQSFEQMMSAAYRLLLVQGRTGQNRFLDVGCGGGTKVFAATRFFENCDGLEYDPKYVNAARETLQLIQAQNCTIHSGDGISYDGYGTYDVIYFYRPIDDIQRLAQMEQKIMTTSKPGTVIVAPYNSFLESRDGIVGSKIVDPIFIAGISQTDADALRAEAECTDTEIVHHGKDFAFDPGFWRPVLDAASFNGMEQLGKLLRDDSEDLPTHFH